MVAGARNAVMRVPSEDSEMNRLFGLLGNGARFASEKLGEGIGYLIDHRHEIKEGVIKQVKKTRDHIDQQKEQAEKEVSHLERSYQHYDKHELIAIIKDEEHRMTERRAAKNIYEMKYK